MQRNEEHTGVTTSPATAPAHGGASSKVLKVMGIFGSVQVLTILCSIVRVKLVALWIGPAGIGLYGVYNSVLELINNTCQLGMKQSGVREIAAVPGHDKGLTGRVVLMVRRWGWVLGAAGLAVTVALSPLLSRYSFGNGEHTLEFIALGAAVLLSALTTSESAIFQGLKRYGRLARGTLTGSIGGLAVSIPLFRWLGEDSILPSVIAYAVCMWIGIGLVHDRSTQPVQRVKWRDSMSQGKRMLVLGSYLTASEFISALVTFIFIGWLNKTSGESATGYFQAGFTIVNRYIGLVFTAIAVEYYPRLAEVSAHRGRIQLYVRHEMGLIMLVLIPIVTWFITADSLVVTLLYNSDFAVIEPFVVWGMVGTALRAFSWCMSFTILARGDGRMLLLTEVASGVIYLGANTIFYSLWGIRGMGVAYAVWYALFAMVITWIYYRVYRYRLSPDAIKLAASSLGMILLCAVLRQAAGWQWAAIVAVAGTLWSYRRLRISFLRGAPGLGGLLRGRRGR